MSRQKKRKSLAKAKNAIRGTFNKPAAPYISYINQYGKPKKSNADLIIGGLASLDEEDAGMFLDWLSGFPSRNAQVFPIEPVRQASLLRIAHVETKLSLGQQIFLICKLLISFKDKIQSFNISRVELETFIVSGRYTLALKLLDRIEDEFGLSLWSIETRISLLQINSGLEAQKEYVASILADAPRSLSSVFAHWISQRNEEGTVYTRYVNRLTQRISNWKTSDNEKSAYTYLFGIRNPMLLRDQDVADTVACVSGISLIDAYLSVRDALAYLFRRGDIRAPLVYLFNMICESTDTLGLRLFEFIANKNIQSRDDLVQHVELPPEWELFQHISLSSDVLAPFSSSFLAQLTPLLLASAERTPGSLAAIDTGSKRLANFRHLDFSKVAAAYVELQMQRTPVFTISEASDLYLFSPTSSPWSSIVMPANQAGRLVSDIRTLSIVNEIDSVRLNDGAYHGRSALARELAARQALARGDGRSAIRAIGEPQPGSVDERRLTPLNVKAHLLEGELDGAVSAAGRLCASTDGAGSILELDDLVNKIRQAEFGIKDKLGLALVLHEALEHQEDHELFQQLQFAYEDVVVERGYQRPSELAAIDGEEAYIIKSFLRKVAVPPVMDVSFWLFKTSRDTLAERIAICSALITADPERALQYREEVKEITRYIDIEDGIEHVDKSRVFVDRSRLSRWAYQELQESFDRYKALTRAGIGYQDAGDFDKLLKDFVAGHDVSFGDLSQFPRDEAGQLLISLIDEVRDKYLNDEDFGLDAYLSMRVRHGSVAGYLRGPLEEAGILVPRDKATDRFHVSAEWSAFREEIVAFSERYEDLVDDLTQNRLQITSARHPDGLFHLAVQPLTVYFIRSRIDESTQLSEFLAQIYEVNDILLARSLQDVRSFIATNFREGVEASLGQMVEFNGSGEDRSKLRNAIAACSTDWQASVDRVASWFAPNEEGERATFRTLQQIVEIAIQATRNAHRGFDPVLEIYVDDLGPQAPDVLVIFTDILFTVLDNVHRHCGLPGRPTVSISLRATPTDEANIERLNLRVENEVSPSAQSSAVLGRLARIRELVASGEYRSKVKLEGGTGILKLKKIIANDARQSIDFGFVGNRFYIEVGIYIVIVSRDEVTT